MPTTMKVNGHDSRKIALQLQMSNINAKKLLCYLEHGVLFNFTFSIKRTFQQFIAKQVLKTLVGRVGSSTGRVGSGGVGKK
jgi:hypothetical protein